MLHLIEPAAASSFVADPQHPEIKSGDPSRPEIGGKRPGSTAFLRTLLHGYALSRQVNDQLSMRFGGTSRRHKFPCRLSVVVW